MRKRSAVIAGIALMFTAAALVFCVRSGRETPDFIFSEPSPVLISSSETVGSHETAHFEETAESEQIGRAHV